MAENPPKQSAESPKITLRPMQLRDLDDFMVWASDDRVSEFCLWDSFTSREQALDFLNTNATVHPWYRVICIDNHAVGSISVSPRSGNDKCTAMLSYALVYEYWGKGIMTEVLKVVSRMIFDEWPHLERLEARVTPENVGSQRALEKAGFVKEGVLRKLMVMKGKCIDVAFISLLSCECDRSITTLKAV